MDLTRQTIPEDMPLFLRISGTDWLENETDMDSWKVEDTVNLAEILAEKGVDLLDVRLVLTQLSALSGLEEEC